MKPDITSPEVDIIAARAAGTSLGEPVNQWYTKLTGTSMATPTPPPACTSRAAAAWTSPTPSTSG
jgi:hypothetical protein